MNVKRYRRARFLGRCVAACLVLCACAMPAQAWADQDGSGTTAVYVVMEPGAGGGAAERAEGAAVLSGDAQPGAEEGAARFGAPGLLPQTGDCAAALALALSLGAAAAASRVLAARRA